MKFHSLTRFPKHAFPADLNTNDAAIDQYLQTLDKGLAGSTGVRRVTLEEVRDHLLEQKSQLLCSGYSESEAGSQATANFGPAEHHAKAQRHERYKLFITMFFRFGLIFASLMLIMNLISTASVMENLSTLATLFLFNMTFYGFFMSYWYSFAFTQAKPAPATQTEQGEVLEVYSQKSSKYAAVFLFVAMGGIAVSCLLGLFGYGYMAASGPVLNIILFILGGQMAIGAHIAWTRYTLSDTQLTQTSLFGSRTFSRDAILDLKERPMWRQFLITSIGKQYALVWRDANGKTQQTTVVINGEMHNSDQLVATLKAATKA
ncbi:hypothetical protein [Aliidiomarina celeris]|uniref:hypothetical protein n=1 Tax=Aliidiomarina celeris TaxID=2249428 RepID=UPI000DEB56FB|nr:hypothetical protein [Aliidiomarina celeris]